MTDPCQQIERLVKTETVSSMVLESLDGLHSKVDRLADDVSELKGRQDTYEKRPYSNTFVGGIAAAGGVFGILLWDVVKPLAKPIFIALAAVIR